MLNGRTEMGIAFDAEPLYELDCLFDRLTEIMARTAANRDDNTHA
jgi:hypothetical protein